jgi:hypothetical protein
MSKRLKKISCEEHIEMGRIWRKIKEDFVSKIQVPALNASYKNTRLSRKLIKVDCLFLAISSELDALWFKDTTFSERESETMISPYYGPPNEKEAK